jgi:sigma-E factor negative regulatory protein RseB
MRRVHRVLARSCGAAWLCLVASWAWAAESGQALGALQWLQRAELAAQKLNYAGVMIYQHGDAVLISRVTHLVDRSGEQEKLELLDGVPREILRHNDRVQSFMPDTKTVFLEPKRDRGNFPSFSAGPLAGIADHYSLKVADVDRVAGVECQVVDVDAKDTYRYGHRFWIDRASGLLLRAQTFNEKRELVEQIAFTEVKIGGAIERAKLKPSYPIQGWKTENAGSQTTDLAASGWILRGLPGGFHKIREVKRKLAGRPDVAQMVLSDGLSTISIFIEPYSDSRGALPVVGAQGAINVYAKRYGSFWLTVLGEVPTVTIQKVASAIELQAKP